jgi:AcrR family transcriptional regulator
LILDGATTLFRRHGYGGVSIDDIGTAAGIAGPAVYRHFDTKEELLATMMSRAGEQLAASVDSARRPERRRRAGPPDHLLRRHRHRASRHDRRLPRRDPLAQRSSSRARAP